jgi:hypothetical protein
MSAFDSLSIVLTSRHSLMLWATTKEIAASVASGMKREGRGD